MNELEFYSHKPNTYIVTEKLTATNVYTPY